MYISERSFPHLVAAEDARSARVSASVTRVMPLPSVG